MAIQTLYLPFDPLYLTLHTLYLCHQTQGISYTTTHSLYDITHIIHVTSYTVCMLSQQLFRILHTSIYNFKPSIFMTSYPIFMLWPYCFHENKMTVPDISPAIFDITATVSVSSHRWHTHLFRCIALSMTSQHVCKSSTWNTYDIIHNLHPITFTLYDMSDHVCDVIIHDHSCHIV